MDAPPLPRRRLGAWATGPLLTVSAAVTGCRLPPAGSTGHRAALADLDLRTGP